MVWTGDIIKLFMCREICGHGTFLLSSGQIPFPARSLAAKEERLGHSHWGRALDTEEGAAGNPVAKAALWNCRSLA